MGSSDTGGDTRTLSIIRGTRVEEKKRKGCATTEGARTIEERRSSLAIAKPSKKVSPDWTELLKRKAEDRLSRDWDMRKARLSSVKLRRTAKHKNGERLLSSAKRNQKKKTRMWRWSPSLCRNRKGRKKTTDTKVSTDQGRDKLTR